VVKGPGVSRRLLPEESGVRPLLVRVTKERFGAGGHHHLQPSLIAKLNVCFALSCVGPLPNSDAFPSLIIPILEAVITGSSASLSISTVGPYSGTGLGFLGTSGVAAWGRVWMDSTQVQD